jgi:hypothetical protein
MPGLASYGAPPIDADKVLELLTKHSGTWWFVNNWLPAGFLETSITGSGYIYYGDIGIRLCTGTTAGSSVRVYKTCYAYGTMVCPDWSKKRYLGVLLQPYARTDQIIHVVSGEIRDCASETNIGDHIGWKIIDNVIYGTVGDGTAEKTIVVDTIPPPPMAIGLYHLECILDPVAGKCSFYKYGNYVGEITENLPIAALNANFLLNASIYNKTAEDKWLGIFTWRVAQFEAGLI